MPRVLVGRILLLGNLAVSVAVAPSPQAARMRLGCTPAAVELLLLLLLLLGYVATAADAAAAGAPPPRRRMAFCELRFSGARLH